MSSVVKLIVGAIEIAVGVILTITGIGAPIGALLISAGSGQFLTGIGSLITSGVSGGPNSASAGITSASRNPIKPWDIHYGRVCRGGTVVFINEFGDTNKYMDLVIVLNSHTSQSVDALLFDKQKVQLSRAGGPFVTIGNSFSPVQQVIGIESMSRLNGVVTLTTQSSGGDIPLLSDGDRIQITGVTATSGQNVNGKWSVFNCIHHPATPSYMTFSFICGGLDFTLGSGGQVHTLWADYGNNIYMEVLLGNQTQTFQGMLTGTPNGGDLSDLIINSDNPWTSEHLLLGKTCVMLRLTYDAKAFAGGIPAISFLLHGKNDIQDPRTSPPTVGYTENAALCIADYLQNTTYGFRATWGSEIPLAPLIAAANICDEAVPLAAGGTEPRYTCNGSFDLSLSPGRILENMLTACAGRIDYAGGQFIIQPAAWYGSTPFPAPGMGQKSGPFKWRNNSIRDQYNGVKGTYINPANNWQPGDIPPYAQDSTHGYTLGSGPWNSETTYHAGDQTVYEGIGYIALSTNTDAEPDLNPSIWAVHYQDINLAADLGERRWREIQLPFTISAATAQRLCSIELRRLRFPGNGTFPFNMAGYAMTAGDVIQMTVPLLPDFTNKNLEVRAHRFTMKEQSVAGRDTPVIVLGVEVDVQETDSSIYDWDETTEELTPTGNQQPTLPNIYTPAPPTNLELESDYYTAVYVKGAVQDAIVVSWTPPADGYILSGGHIELQYSLYIAPVTLGTVSIDTSGVATFSSPVLQQAFNQGSLLVGSPPQVFTLASITSLVQGTVTPAPATAITAATFILTANPAWLGLPSVNPAVTSVAINGVIDGQQYTVQVRGVNGAGVPSEWVTGSVVASGARAPLPWQPNAITPAVSDVITQDATFEIDFDYGTPDASGNYNPQIDIGGYLPVNMPGIAAAPDVSLVTVAISPTGGSLGPGTYTAVLEAWDNTSTTNPGKSPFSRPITFTIASGTTNKAVISGFVFGLNTQGFRLLVGNNGIQSLSVSADQIDPGSLPASLTINALPPRTLGPTDQDADHLHAQAFVVRNGGPWDGNAAGPVVSSILSIPSAAGFTADQFKNYVLEWVPGGNPGGTADMVARAVIETHDTAGNFTLQDSTGWVVQEGDLILCRFNATVSGNVVTDVNIVNAQYPSGNVAGAAIGAELWFLKGGSVSQIRRVIDNDSDSFTLEPGPAIANGTPFYVVYPTAVYDYARTAFVSTNDRPASTLPTVISIPTENYDEELLLIRIFTESVDLQVDSSSGYYPVRLAYVAGQGPVGGGINLGPITQ